MMEDGGRCRRGREGGTTKDTKYTKGKEREGKGRKGKEREGKGEVGDWQNDNLSGFPGD
jgi:hypothetical protein